MLSTDFGVVETGVTTFLLQAVASTQRIIKKNPGPLFINFSIRNFLIECFAVSIQAPGFFPLSYSAIHVAELVEYVSVMIKVRGGSFSGADCPLYDFLSMLTTSFQLSPDFLFAGPGNSCNYSIQWRCSD